MSKRMYGAVYALRAFTALNEVADIFVADLTTPATANRVAAEVTQDLQSR